MAQKHLRRKVGKRTSGGPVLPMNGLAGASVFSRDLSNNKISSLSNSSFTNMSQLTTL